MRQPARPQYIGLVEYLDPDETLSVAELKQQARIDFDDEDALLGAFCAAAREVCEVKLLSKVRRQRVELHFGVPGDGLLLMGAGPNVELVSVSVINPGDSTLVQPNDLVLVKGPFCAVQLAANSQWPEVDFGGHIRVVVDAGYPTAAETPEAIRQWIRMMGASMYRNRESHSKDASNSLGFVDGLLDPYRVHIP